MRTLFAAAAIAALSATATLALDNGEVADTLLDMGYTSVNMTETNDTVTFVADAQGTSRTIVYNGETGQILSDTALELTEIQDAAFLYIPSSSDGPDEASTSVYDTNGEDSDLGVSINGAAGIDPDDL